MYKAYSEFPNDLNLIFHNVLSSMYNQVHSIEMPILSLQQKHNNNNTSFKEISFMRVHARLVFT